MTSARRVAVTGMGTVNSLGTNCRDFWERLIAGKSGLGTVESFDSAAWRTHVGCEIKEFLPETGHPDRVYDLAVSAAREAINQAGGQLPPERTAVVIGTLQGGMRSLEDELARQIENQQEINPGPSLPVYMLSGISRYLGSVFGFHGPMGVPVIACAASGAAISRAMDLIRLGHADAVVTGGADAFCQLAFSGFNALRSAAPKQCAPFSINHEGLVIGEGAGILILEALESARQRGAVPLAYAIGAGLAEDAYHITAPEPEGSGAARAMQAALADAGLEPTDIDYVNAHGTGTPQNDSMESRAFKKVFGERVSGPPISSIKAAVGHCMGAAGAVEAVASVLTILNGTLPPTLNYLPGAPDCTLDYIPDLARPAKVRNVLSNSFGFGGNNASLIFSSARDDADTVQA